MFSVAYFTRETLFHDTGRDNKGEDISGNQTEENVAILNTHPYQAGCTESWEAVPGTQR